MSIVETRRLTKIYGQGETAVTALNNVDLAVEAGAFVAVMGPSGCGKSTLLHLIGGLDRPTSGQVMINGQDIALLGDLELTELRRRKMGFIFQFYNLIPVLDAVENAALPLILDGVKQSEAREKAGEWLGRLGLGERLRNKPHELSGGQQQRVAIARALTSEPALVLADEPTGNLDSKAADEIADLLRRASSEWERSVLMVTHDPRIAAHADRVVFLKDGALVNDVHLGAQETSSEKMVRERMEQL